MPKLTAIRKQALDEMMKEALFEATIAVLTEHGVEGMTMDRVAQAAGMAKGSLYNYFRSKKDLIEFVYAKTVDPVFQNLTEIVASVQPAADKLAAHLHMLLGHVATHAEVFRRLFDDDTAQGLLQSSERTTREAVSQSLAEVIRQGIDEGTFRPVDPFVLANMFLGLCRGALVCRPMLEDHELRERVHCLIMETFLHGVAAEGGRV